MKSIDNAPEERRSPRTRTVLVVLAVLTPLLALLVIRPWTPSAFPVWDYSEMLPLLHGSDGLVDAFTKLAEFTRLDGRANYLTYLQIAGTWVAVGDSPVGWQWQRAILMLIVGILLAVTILRLGGSPLAAAAASLIAILTVPATEGWLFLMGEPLATIGLLGIVLLMPREGGWPMSWRRGIAVATCALGVTLAKEFLGLIVPIALAIGFFQSTIGQPRAARLLRPPWQAIVPLAIAAVVAATNTFWAWSGAVDSAYAHAFAPSLAGLTRIPELFEAMLLPVRFTSADRSSLLYPANLMYMGMLGVALGTCLAHREHLGPRLRLIGLLLALPAIGAVSYAFWPRYSAFYGIPFAIGGAGLLAGAMTVLESTSRRGHMVAASILLAIVVFTGSVSQQVVNDKRAIADLALAVSRIVQGETGMDTLLVVKAGQGGNRWPVTGPELEHYVAATRTNQAPAPVIRDATCPEVTRYLAAGHERIGILNDQNRCGPLPEATFTLVALVRRMDWGRLSLRSDSLTIQLLLPTATTR